MNDEIEQELYCPITQQILLEPVIASDNITYEKDAIEQWLESHNTSPLTNLVMSKVLQNNMFAKKMINIYLTDNPSKKKEQYLLQFSIKKLNSLQNEIEMISYINKFNTIDFDFYNLCASIYKMDNVMTLLIDKMVNIDQYDKQHGKLIHYICCYSTSEIIKYIIDKGVDLECLNVNKQKPIHYICQYSTPEMIKYIINKGVDLECQNIYNWRPIHYIIGHSTPEMIKYIIDKGVNLECQTNDEWKWSPLHFICYYSTPEMIKYIIDKDVNLECQMESFDWIEKNILIDKTKKENGVVKTYMDIINVRKDKDIILELLGNKMHEII